MFVDFQLNHHPIEVWGDDLDYLDLIDEHNKRELGKKTICKWNS